MSYNALNILQKHSSVPSIHLDMMKLERDRKGCLEEALAITPPQHHRVVETFGILVDYTVQLCLHHRRCSYNHHLTVEQLQIIAIRNIAIVDAPFAIYNDRADRNTIEAEHPVFNRQVKEFRNP